MTLEMIDPEQLTPASARALHRIRTGFVLFVVFAVVASGFIVNRADSVARCSAKQYTWDAVHQLTIPQPTKGLVDGSLQLRLQGNANKLAERNLIGARPSC